jgi:hypothetical protein
MGLVPPLSDVAFFCSWIIKPETSVSLLPAKEHYFSFDKWLVLWYICSMSEWKDNIISGQVMFRATPGGPHNAPDGTPRRLMMVFGIIAVPDSVAIQDEHQYPVCSSGQCWSKDSGSMDVLLRGGINRKEIARGCTPNGLLEQPMWQC